MLQSPPPRFIPFALALMRQQKWHYAGGILAVILVDAVQMMPALIVKEVTNLAQINPQGFDLLPFALKLAGCYVAIAILRMAWRFLIMLPSRWVERDLRQAAYEKLLHSDYATVASLKTGDVISCLTQDIGNIRMFMGPGVLVMVDSLAYMIFVPLTLLSILGPKAWWVLIPFVALGIILRIVHKPLASAHESVSDQLGGLSQYVYEESSGAKFFRAQGLITGRRHRYALLLERLLGKQLEIARWELRLDGTLQLVVQGSYLVVLGLAWGGRHREALFLGSLTVSLQLLDKLLWPMMSVNYLMNLYQAAAAGARRLHPVLSLQAKDLGFERYQGPLQQIRLENLTVHSPEGKVLLANVNLALKAGETNGVVGPVGSGKSVLLQVLAGLWEPQYLSYTTFTYNDVDYRHLDRRQLWQELSLIPQTPQIFGKSLAQNISPALPLEAAALHAALEAADLSQDVLTLPAGLSTLIGEKGMNLSGGQKQRTLIARSFRSKASLHLWDDAISALDPATEKKVITNLNRLAPQSLFVLATHRWAALEHFQHIYQVEAGSVREVPWTP